MTDQLLSVADFLVAVSSVSTQGRHTPALRPVVKVCRVTGHECPLNHSIKVESSDVNHSFKVKPSHVNQSIKVKPSDVNQSIKVKPSHVNQSIKVKPSDVNQSIKVKPSDVNHSIKVKPSDVLTNLMPTAHTSDIIAPSVVRDRNIMLRVFGRFQFTCTH